MRFYLKDSERRPDPQPVPTDDRKAVISGLAGWLVALIVVVVVAVVGAADGALIATCAAGIVLGVALLVYTQHRRRRRG